jgi:adenylate cyclase
VERARNKPATELSSYECTLLASQDPPESAEMIRRARTCLDTTVKRDPTYAEAWNALSHILSMQYGLGIGLASPEAKHIDQRAYLVPRIVEAGNRAVELAPQSASAHLSLFTAYRATCEPERMRVEAERVLAINPNDAGALGIMSMALIVSGGATTDVSSLRKLLSFPDKRRVSSGGRSVITISEGENTRRRLRLSEKHTSNHTGSTT